MEKLTNKMDSVFDDVSDSVTDFDVMFDDDDHLVDLVEGFSSNGKPLTGDEFEDIHLSDDEKGDLDSTSDLDDDCDPNDIKDALTGDELMGASIKDIENGSEWDIDDNNKYFKNEEKDAAEKWFEDSDKEYQKSDFHGSVDPEDINKSLAAQREAAAFLEEENDMDKDSEKEVKGNDDKTQKSNNKEKDEDVDLDESFDFDRLLEDTVEDTVHDDIDSTDDIMDKNPKDEFDLEDEDDAESRKDNTVEGDGVGELDEFANFLESDDEGIIADNNEAEVHSDVQCDGTENCNCPMCKEKKLNDSELAVGDTFKESFLDAPDVTDPILEGADGTDSNVPVDSMVIGEEDDEQEEDQKPVESAIIGEDGNEEPNETTQEATGDNQEAINQTKNDDDIDECGDAVANFDDWTADKVSESGESDEEIVGPEEDMEDIAVLLADDDSI